MGVENVILQGAYEKQVGIHYEVNPNENPLGTGGSGTVRRGLLVNEQNGTTRGVAIKFLFDDLNENAISRSRREASIHIVHENLVEMLGFMQIGEPQLYGKSNVHYHVISEYLQGVMLLDLINGKTHDQLGKESSVVLEYLNLFRRNRTKFAVNIIRSVLSGVLALHDNGYIHRDIDPSNIMITNDGKVKLIDLGIAKRLSNLTTQDGHTQLGQFIGKASYAAPEQIRGDIRSQNQTTDIYAIGIMFYQLVTGTLPFVGSTDEVIYKQQYAKMPLRNISDKGIRKIIKKATAKKQSDRFQSAAEFRVALEQLDKNLRDSGYSHIKGESKSLLSSLIDRISTSWRTILIWIGVITVGIAIGILSATF